MKDKVKMLEAVVQKMFLNIIKLDGEVNELKTKNKNISKETDVVILNIKYEHIQISKIFLISIFSSLRRDYTNQLMTTFIPSFCILTIAQTTVYFKNEHFKTSVPVVVSSLLGMYPIS